jgi:FMN-dependent oxidoreductase (nitrilotriacetate monooxygenase family)
MMHIVAFVLNSPINHTVGSWRHPADERIDGLSSVRYWQDMARTLEKGCFDALFFADVSAAYDQYRGGTDDVVRYGVSWPNHDPAIPLAIAASVTEHLGLVVTRSTSAATPYDMVRSLSTLDYVSGGRVGWNIVTGHLRAEHRSHGLVQNAHDDRYDRAQEYLQICHALWDGFEPDAVKFNRETGVFADPTKVHRVDFEGKYLRINAVPPVLPSAQGKPVLFQAGSSSRGQDFAILNSEAVFAVQSTMTGMRGFMGQISDRAAQLERPTPRVTFGVQAILGGTEEEAKANQRALADGVILDAALARLSGMIGIDLSTYDLDRPLEEQKTEASQGGMKTYSGAADKRQLTLREAALLAGQSTGMPQIVGTPEQVAMKLIEMQQETGCFGYNLTPAVNDSSLRDFVEQVVPILQAKGAYRKEYKFRTLRENLSEA